MQRRLAAILSADVHGYSRLMGEDEEDTVRALTASRDVIARAVTNLADGSSTARATTCLLRRQPMRSWLWLSIIWLLPMTSAPFAQPAAKLDGVWTAVAAERDGKNATDVVGHKVTFSAGKFTITRDGKPLYAGTYTADAAKQPPQIDFVNTDGGLKGTWKGIFQLDGVTLKTCDNAPDMAKPRPTAFTAPAGSGYIFIVFMRDKSQ